MFSVDSIIQQTSIESALQFFARAGYRHAVQSRRTWVINNEAGDAILFPAAIADDRDIRLALSAYEALTTENLNLFDIATLANLPQCDVIRHGISGADADRGNVHLEFSESVTTAWTSILRFAAAGVLTSRTDYRGVPEGATLLTRQVRLGHTETGSFVFKFFCPVAPAGLPQDAADGNPLGRTTVQAIEECLEFLSSTEADEPGNALPPALNRQVANAVASLTPYKSLFTSAKASFAYSHELGNPSPTGVIEKFSTVAFDPFVYTRAQIIGDRLKKAESMGRERLYGHILRLEKESPDKRKDRSYEIGVRVKYGPSRRDVSLKLLPAQYKKAIQWHDQEVEVLLDAVIDKRGPKWVVARLFSLQPVQGEIGPNAII
ncbi:MAG: hypothetical protein ACTS27_02675 [Phycisphaerales bacterium]